MRYIRTILVGLIIALLGLGFFRQQAELADARARVVYLEQEYFRQHQLLDAYRSVSDAWAAYAQVQDRVAQEYELILASLKHLVLRETVLDRIVRLQPDIEIGLAHAIRDAVIQAHLQHELDPLLILALMWHESGFDPQATIPAGARGLMQVMPFNAPGQDLYDPHANIQAGTAYLAEQLRAFGRLDRALLAYNRGPATVRTILRQGGDPRNGFERRVLQTYETLRA